MIEERMSVVSDLWDAGISAELLMKTAPKIQVQLKSCSSKHIPIAVLLSKAKLENGKVLFF
jgi:histidyl-tRNA synthetase